MAEWAFEGTLRDSTIPTTIGSSRLVFLRPPPYVSHAMPDNDPGAAPRNGSNDPIDDPLSDELDGELELEPVDPEILEHQRQRVKNTTRALEDRVDIEELFEAAEQADPITIDEVKQFRFNTRHLLTTTALLAVAMTVSIYLGACMGLFVGGCIALAAGWRVVMQKERSQRAAQERRRHQMELRLAAHRAAEDGEPVESPPANEPASGQVTRPPRPVLSFSFSIKQLLGTFAVAAVALGLMRGLGGAENAALLLGLIALAGLCVHVLGFDAPPIIIFGWWLLLVLYILMGLLAAVTSNDETALNRLERPETISAGQELLPGDVLLTDPRFHAPFQHV